MLFKTPHAVLAGVMAVGLAASSASAQAEKISDMTTWREAVADLVDQTMQDHYGIKPAEGMAAYRIIVDEDGTIRERELVVAANDRKVNRLAEKSIDAIAALPAMPTGHNGAIAVTVQYNYMVARSSYQEQKMRRAIKDGVYGTRIEQAEAIKAGAPLVTMRFEPVVDQ